MLLLFQVLISIAMFAGVVSTINALVVDHKRIKKEVHKITTTPITIKKSYQLADDVEILISNVITQACQEAIHEEYSSSHRFYGLEGKCICDDCNKPKAVSQATSNYIDTCQNCKKSYSKNIDNGGLCKHCHHITEYYVSIFREMSGTPPMILGSGMKYLANGL